MDVSCLRTVRNLRFPKAIPPAESTFLSSKSQIESERERERERGGEGGGGGEKERKKS